MAQEGFIRNLPKAELHLHLDGTLTPKLALELAREQNHPLAKKSLEEIKKIITIPHPMTSLKEVLAAFKTICSLLKHPRALERVIEEIFERAHRDNIRYFEVRYAPLLSTTPEFSIGEVMATILNALKKGEKAFGIKSGFILSLLRNLSRQSNEIMFEEFLKFTEKNSVPNVVGVDLANDEADRSLGEFADFFKEATRHGLKTTVHAGEVFPSPDLGTALDLGVDRLGHAVFLTKYPDLLEEVARKKLPIEVNLTSNVRTNAVKNYKEHPLATFLEKGIPIAISTDDPGLFGIDLTHEYKALAQDLGLSQAEIRRIANQSFECAFLKEDVKMGV